MCAVVCSGYGVAPAVCSAGMPDDCLVPAFGYPVCQILSSMRFELRTKLCRVVMFTHFSIFWMKAIVSRSSVRPESQRTHRTTIDRSPDAPSDCRYPCISFLLPLRCGLLVPKHPSSATSLPRHSSARAGDNRS